VARARSERGTEPVRWPAFLAVAVAAALYALLPSAITVLPRVLVPAIALALLVPIAVIHRRRMTGRDRVARVLAVCLLLVLALVNTVSLVVLLAKLVSSQEKGSALLLGALQVWLVNGIVFALAYWEIDRGGPIRRATDRRTQLPEADFRFPQDENQSNVDEVAAGSSVKSDWRPSFMDYLYVSCTNSTAYSPTDTMPLTSRAKALMAVQCVESIVLTVLVIARGVSLLG
jgi:hypothetical protein